MVVFLSAKGRFAAQILMKFPFSFFSLTSFYSFPPIFEREIYSVTWLFLLSYMVIRVKNLLSYMVILTQLHGYFFPKTNFLLSYMVIFQK